MRIRMANANRQLLVWAPLAACCALLAVTTVIQGRMSERWAPFPELEDFAARVKNVPLHFGQWVGTELSVLDPRTAAAAGSVGDIQRAYKSAAGQIVKVSLLCGRPKEMYYHTPDRCYKFQGFESQGSIKEITLPIGEGSAEFKMNDFFKSSPTGNDSQRVYWSFAADGVWKAPGDSALGFPGARALYKIYVITPGAGPGAAAEGSEDKNPAADLIRELIPQLNAALFPQQDGKTASRD